jgi:hypothetical protein
MPSKKEELEKLRSYLMGLPVVQTQIKLRSELVKHILSVCKKHSLKEKHIKDILYISEYYGSGNCSLPSAPRRMTKLNVWEDGPHITDFIFSKHPATKNKRSAWNELKPWLDAFHSRYYGDPPALQKVHVQIKTTSFVLHAEYGMLQEWLKRVSELKADHFSDGVVYYQVRERGIPHDHSVNAKVLERTAQRK